MPRDNPKSTLPLRVPPVRWVTRTRRSPTGAVTTVYRPVVSPDVVSARGRQRLIVAADVGRLFVDGKLRPLEDLEPEVAVAIDRVVRRREPDGTVRIVVVMVDKLPAIEALMAEQGLLPDRPPQPIH